MDFVDKISPRAKARFAGLFELLEGSASTFGQVIILNRLVVEGDPATTAGNLLSHQSLVWAGFAVALLGVIFHGCWALLMYDLLKNVHQSLAKTAVFFVGICCVLQAIAAFFYISPLLVLNHGAVMGLDMHQAQSASQVLLQLNGLAFQIDLVFFGIWCFLTGYLIFKSGFLPWIIGVLLMVDGVGWMLFMVPPFAESIFTAIAIASGLAEIPLQLWLLIFGLNKKKFDEATASRRLRI